MPGPSLTQLVHEQGPLPPDAVLTLAAGPGRGAGAIHAAGVVHRDLKPTNVLLAHDGPRVIDFGISRALEATMMTTTGMVIGSPGFMSPEQAQGETVGPPSDVFSLGAVLAYAATGQGPFGDRADAGAAVPGGQREAALGGVPAEIAGLARRCLAKDPAARPAPAVILAELGPPALTAGWLPAFARSGEWTIEGLADPVQAESVLAESVLADPVLADPGPWTAGHPGTEVAAAAGPGGGATPSAPAEPDGQETLTSGRPRPPATPTSPVPDGPPTPAFRERQAAQRRPASPVRCPVQASRLPAGPADGEPR